MGSIHDLGMVMKDLSALVIEQGTVLDRIDCQLQETSAVVEQGVSQLRRAEKAQRRGILASCVLILCAMIAFSVRCSYHEIDPLRKSTVITRQ